MGSKPKLILLDLDGTLYFAGRAIPGAADAIASLRRSGYRLRFLTNTDSKTPDQVLRDIESYELGVRAEELFTPVVAALGLFAALPAPRLFSLVSANLEPLFRPYGGDGAACSHVLVGDCRDRLDYQNLDRAFRALRGGAELLALQHGRYFKAADGDHLDTGAIVAALEYASGNSARILGKPSPDFLDLAARSAGVTAAEIAVVGDDATTDMAMARAAGSMAIAVRTGKFADQTREGRTIDADQLIDSVADLPEILTRVG
jgi:HAD superfamily hydrolase (TIGR01458 family)